MMRTIFALCLGLIPLAAAGADALSANAKGAGDATTLTAALMQGIPQGFPRFKFAADPAAAAAAAGKANAERARLLTHYLWHHFDTRLGNTKTLFNKEYLTIADMWLGGAADKRLGKSIQEVHRDELTGILLDAEGYVHTHQHPSHAHEHGWPFPLWTQAAPSPEEILGNAVGWHFNEQGKGWAMDPLRIWAKNPLLPRYIGEAATQGWELDNLKSLGVKEGKWQLESTGPSPALVTPAGFEFDTVNAPFMQLRWTRTGTPPNHVLPYLEWLREGDTEFGPDRRACIYSPPEEAEAYWGAKLSMVELYRHPLWKGKIKRVRLSLAPGESGVKFAIDSFFTQYDTRHSINNPIYILACWNYFRWTGDLPFLQENISRMRLALRYQQTVMGGLQYNRIRNPWPGHDSLPGYVKDAAGRITPHSGHGIGNNYYDLLPFGWDDMYSTSQYYAATVAMADAEQAVRDHPGWGMPLGALALDPAELRTHAARVKETANRLFWNDRTGRFNGSIDPNDKAYDYGFTFLNLDAIWYGIATDEHARAIMDWIDGRRIVAGDTSTGADIYHWRFGPRATTLRNLDWYGQGWTHPETIAWGGQVQDGGAVLGFSFYDLWARLKVNGPDDAWQRLCGLLDWEKEVWTAGGYRKYYEGGVRGTTLQGGGTAGGLGIDFEFYESSLVPSIVVYGFMGLDPQADALALDPRLPKACPEMTATNLLYRNVSLDVKASNRAIEINVKDEPVDPLAMRLTGDWTLAGTGRRGADFALPHKGNYRFERRP
ncbi:MAG: hypothetical protein M1457_09540 [bacterium]|nr:hypothetical protein [bacterium]